MTPSDFRRIALSFEGAEQGSHMGAVDFRVGGRVFATLAAEKLGYGNLMLAPEQQADFVSELPDVFLPIHGGWGRMGMTHIRLAEASEDVLTGALRTAWMLRVQKNQRSGKSATRRKSLDRPAATSSARASKQNSSKQRDAKPRDTSRKPTSRRAPRRKRSNKHD